MKIAVLGMGGIGGVVGASLAGKYDDIYFIARGENLKAINRNGLTLKSDRLGTFTVRPRLATDNVNDIGTVDALIIATKSYSLEAACVQCMPLIGQNTLVLPLLNGVSVSDDVESCTGGMGQVADGCIYAFSNIVSPGVVAHIGELCHIDFGFKDGRKTPEALELCTMLTESGIETVLSDDIMVPVWEKYIMMCGNSCVFSYFECTAGEVHSDSAKSKYIADVYTELYTIARACGVNVSDTIVEKYIDTFSRLPEDAITSLYRDIKSGKADTEFDAIIGKAYRLSQKTGVDAPCIKAVYEKYKK
ncbi:2-dehydropantoate 2-reductase [Lachnospiraceae bacterium NSJ-143]|nr:2-dehydropantoate 2-reductase [Lachnospiraceae bacterium NSJ-143]